MPIRLVKLIDLYVGTVLFALLNVLALVVPSRRRAEPSRILLVKFWGIGSILLLSPVFRALRRHHPSSQITLLTLSRNRQLAPLLPQVDEILALDLEKTHRVPWNLVALAARVARGRYDIVVDCEFFAKVAAILTFLSRAPVRVGFHRDELLRRRLYTAGVPFRHDRHVTASFADLLAPLGIAVDASDAALGPPAPEARAEADALLASLVGHDGPFVAMNVNASELAYERRWPPDRFALLAAEIVRRLDLDVVLVGSAAERGYVEEVARKAGPRVHNAAGRTTLPGLAALLCRSLLFVSNDSGPLHLAALSGVPCAALFGPETPDLYGPVDPSGQGRHRVFYRRLPCSPCMSVHDMKQVVCHGQIDCLRGIPVEEVLSGILEHARALAAGASAR